MSSVQVGPRLCLALVLFIGAVWAWAGLDKLTGLDEFRRTIHAHGILPDRYSAFLAVIPAVEVGFGFAIVAFGAGSRRAWVLISTLLLLGLFTAYLLAVPAHTRAAAGCGCGLRVIPLTERLPWWPWARNGGLALAHVAAMLLPLTRDAAATPTV